MSKSIPNLLSKWLCGMY